MNFSRIVFECEKPYPVSKCADLENVSDMNEVKRLANKLLSTKYYDGGVVPLAVSNRKGKKFMIQSPDGKWIHFGDINLEDYTKHKDEDRLDRFLTRNRRFKDADTFTPAWMAYHLLWGKGLGSSKVAPEQPKPKKLTSNVIYVREKKINPDFKAFDEENERRIALKERIQKEQRDLAGIPDAPIKKQFPARGYYKGWNIDAFPSSSF